MYFASTYLSPNNMSINIKHIHFSLTRIYTAMYIEWDTEISLSNMYIGYHLTFKCYLIRCNINIIKDEEVFHLGKQLLEHRIQASRAGRDHRQR